MLNKQYPEYTLTFVTRSIEMSKTTYKTSWLQQRNILTIYFLQATVQYINKTQTL